ncbi:MAG TPA: hypothetical protein VHN55_01860 [Sphingomicrobium sp.]|nr:hypothetical protein [Sphingomicrobium sp.]
MFDRRLVRDIALAALIAFPAVLPASPTPRSPESRIAAEGSGIVLADAGIGTLAGNAEATAQGRS